MLAPQPTHCQGSQTVVCLDLRAFINNYHALFETVREPRIRGFDTAPTVDVPAFEADGVVPPFSAGCLTGGAILLAGKHHRPLFVVFRFSGFQRWTLRPESQVFSGRTSFVRPLRDSASYQVMYHPPADGFSLKRRYTFLASAIPPTT